jgi:hypothetical protein
VNQSKTDLESPRVTLAEFWYKHRRLKFDPELLYAGAVVVARPRQLLPSCRQDCRFKPADELVDNGG